MTSGAEPAIVAAVQALRAGQLVVLPTETVYGLAADARNRAAVARIFAAKGRPADNPLIVHVTDSAAAFDVGAAWRVEARRLAEAFWPGPLTLVLPKRPTVPDLVTAGQPTVAVRAPDHAVAQAVLRTCGFPLAAPSANRFMRLSPTAAPHLDPDMAAHVAAVLDGGPSVRGLESTIVDLTGFAPRLLRPGSLPASDVERVLGRRLQRVQDEAEGPRASPGRYSRHYAPVARLAMVDRADPGAAALVFGTARGPRHLSMPTDSAGYASALYAALHLADARGWTDVQVERPPEGPELEAVRDRLARASAPTGIGSESR